MATPIKENQWHNINLPFHAVGMYKNAGIRSNVDAIRRDSVRGKAMTVHPHYIMAIPEHSLLEC